MSAEKILVVDDIATNRKLLHKMLVKIAGYVVVEAANGKDAITVFEKENPDLILMDINMPEMDGMRSTAKIKEIMGDDYIPIIFVTALSAESSLANALAAGGDDFIGKPFNVEVLRSKINAHLRIRDLNQQLLTNNKKLNESNMDLMREHELIEYFFNNALQKSFLDKKLINYHMSPMSVFNGDIFLAKRSPNGGLYIVMGDFTGHGLAAAMGTLPVAMIFFKMVSESGTVSDIARELNHQLSALMPTSMFFAASLLELNAAGDVLTVWMGGMPKIYWLGDDGNLKGVVKSQHMPLGILDDKGFDSATQVFDVEKNDKFYLYSDGITEACRPNGEMFGEERLAQVIIDNRDNCIDKVLRALNLFRGDVEQDDDITIVELSCCEIPTGEAE